MHQVKLFKSVETEIKNLEADINQWLESEQIEVINIFGNIAPQSGSGEERIGDRRFNASDVLLAVLYKK